MLATSVTFKPVFTHSDNWESGFFTDRLFQDYQKIDTYLHIGAYEYVPVLAGADYICEQAMTDTLSLFKCDENERINALACRRRLVLDDLESPSVPVIILNQRMVDVMAKSGDWFRSCILDHESAHVLHGDIDRPEEDEEDHETFVATEIAADKYSAERNGTKWMRRALFRTVIDSLRATYRASTYFDFECDELEACRKMLRNIIEEFTGAGAVYDRLIALGATDRQIARLQRVAEALIANVGSKEYRELNAEMDTFLEALFADEASA